MRNQWLRLLLLRRQNPSHPCISQVQHLRSFTSCVLPPRAPLVGPNPFSLRRRFTSSSEPAVEPPQPSSDQAVVVADIFAKREGSNNEVKKILDSKNVVITHDLILSVLGHPDTEPDVAKHIFDWVLENESEKLSSVSYNLMLGVLGGNGFVKDTWDMIGTMKEKGYGLSKESFDKISLRFQKDGLNNDAEKLKELYDSGSLSCMKNDAIKENVVDEKNCRVSEIIKREVWGEHVEKQLQELGVEFSSDLVTSVLKNLKFDPNKALIFFRWVQESVVFKHDQRSFNVMARVLAEADQGQKLWRVVDEMRSEGHEMERETCAFILKQFVERNMIKDAVDLYEFAMNGADKPLEEDCILLLKGIVVSEELDMDLFLRVVGASKDNANEFADAIVNATVKSLISVGRLKEGERMFTAMKEAGFVPSAPSRCNLAFDLGSGGKTDLALEFMDKMVPSLDKQSWECLIKGFCLYGDLDEASNSLRKMVEKEGVSCAMRSLEVLVGSYCEKREPFDAYKFVLEMVNDKGLIPWYSTYKKLTKGLLDQNHFKEALDVTSMVKEHYYPPYLYPFVGYLSRTGSAEDAIRFTQAVTSKRFPAINVFTQLFKAYLRVGRLSEAQDFLMKCPAHIRNHADVLTLFASKSGLICTADVGF